MTEEEHDGLDELTTSSYNADNSENFRLSNDVNSYLKGYREIAMLVLPCCCSLMVDCIDRPCSVMLIDKKGGGKSTFMNILDSSNKKKVTRLPSKIYGWEMVSKFKKESFKDKMLIHDDLIVAFDGLSVKSQKQLLGFFSELLSSGKYEQLGNIVTGNCSAVFGMAREFYKTHHAEMFTSTFLDRFGVIHAPNRDDEDMMGVLDVIDERENPPIIKLPLSKKKAIHYDINVLDKESFHRLCIMMDKKGIMSFTRAKVWMINWMKGNALLNKRDTVNNNDFMLMQDLSQLFISMLTNQERVVKGLLMYPDLSDNDLIQKLNISKRTFYRYKSVAKSQGWLK